MNRKQLDALTRELRNVRRSLKPEEQGPFITIVDAIANVFKAYNSNFNSQKFKDEVYR